MSKKSQLTDSKKAERKAKHDIFQSKMKSVNIFSKEFWQKVREKAAERKARRAEREPREPRVKRERTEREPRERIGTRNTARKKRETIIFQPDDHKPNDILIATSEGTKTIFEQPQRLTEQEPVNTAAERTGEKVFLSQHKKNRSAAGAIALLAGIFTLSKIS